MMKARAALRLGVPLLTALGFFGLNAHLARAQAEATGASWGEMYRLPNGLRVVLSPDARFPTVTVLVRYHVGARQEPAGASGIAHLLEHLSFRVPRPPVKSSTHAAQFTVSSRNGTTSYEQTDYYTTTPNADLKYALWTERWRMGLKLSDVTESDRRQELDVEEERLRTERAREDEERARLADRLPIARRRLAEVDAEIASLGG